jgi:glycosyltransferase involved in cell wall biosynthesis
MPNTILLTLPSLQGQGGVASFYKGVLPHFPQGKVVPLEIGGEKNSSTLFHPLVDQIRFRHTAKKIQPSLIHLNPSLDFKSFIRDGLFAWQAKQMGYPLLIFWRGWNKNFENDVEKKYLGFFKHTFGRADCFIVLASEFKRKLRYWGVTVPVYRETTSVDNSLLRGVTVLDKWTNAVQLPKIKILFLARLVRTKGVFEMIQAIKLLVDKKLPVCLTIAGDGKIRPELEKYTRTLGLTPQQVKFTGDIRGEDKIRILTEQHIYCLPSYGEGLPNSVLEAMVFGMPVVTRPVGGLADIFEDGKMGKLVQGKSSEEIAACLEKMIFDKEKMAEIGRYNAKYAKEHFLASVVAERLFQIHQTVINTTTHRIKC